MQVQPTVQKNRVAFPAALLFLVSGLALNHWANSLEVKAIRHCPHVVNHCPVGLDVPADGVCVKMEGHSHGAILSKVLEQRHSPGNSQFPGR